MGDSMSTIINATTTNGVVIQPDNSGSLVLQTNNGTTALAIDTSQNVTVGTTATTYNYQTKNIALYDGASSGISIVGGSKLLTFATQSSGGCFIGTRSNDELKFTTNDTERMRIDSSGQILVGASSVPFSNSQFSDGSLYTNNNIFVNNTSGTANYNIRLDGFSDQVYFVWSNGNTQNNTISYAYGGTAWVNSSDETLKDIIEPITNAVDKVSQLRSVIGKFKTEEEGTRHPFLIAQDVQKVLPEAVYVNKSRVEGEPDTLGIGYTDTIPLLVAAIKEQQTIINDLKARVETLEAK